tara:strand:+ start:4606 stop:4908 length:303 start_codon:yes stop_codon:yes gene_type:complete
MIYKGKPTTPHVKAARPARNTQTFLGLASGLANDNNTVSLDYIGLLPKITKATLNIAQRVFFGPREVLALIYRRNPLQNTPQPLLGGVTIQAWMPGDNSC